MFKIIANLISPITIVERYSLPGSEQLIATVRAGDFAAVEQTLHGGDVDLRLSLIDSLSRARTCWPQLARWHEQSPNSYTAALLGGASQAMHAWDARGGDWRPQNYSEFQKRLTRAHATLDACTAANPKDPAPWAWLMAVSMGRGLGTDATTAFFRDAWKRSGPSFEVGSHALQAFAPKWGSPEGTLESVVRWMSQEAPVGHGVHALLADAAVELVAYRCMSLGRIEGDMFSLPGIAPLVSQAEQLWHKSPGRVASPLDSARHSVLAYCHWQAGNTSLAAPHLQALNRVFNEYPWGLGGDPAAEARKAIKACGI